MIESLDISAIRAGYAAGSFTPHDLIREVYDRIDKGDPAIWISLIPLARSLELADTLERGGPGDSMPLWGIPFAVKDNIDVAGIATTAGCPDYEYSPESSAHVVELLLQAGAIPIGKTNLDQFATGLVGTRTPYGIPRNAIASDYIPGGSSSGSAVAVASGLVSFSLGTDTAGSGRIPAAFNNIVGVKPTRGWVSTRGVVPACRSLDCVSVFGLTVADATEVTEVIGSFDSEDAFARPAPARTDALRKRRVFALPRPEQLNFFGDDSAKSAFDSAVANLKALGWQELRIDFSPFADAARLLYEGPWVAERYAAIRTFIEQRPSALHPVTRAIIEPAIDSSAVAFFEASYRLAELKRQAEAIWEIADCLVTPTAGTIYTVEGVEGDPLKLNTNLGFYTNFMNLLDLCAIAVPAGRTSESLPFGITLAAPAFADKVVAELADAFHRQQRCELGATSVSLTSTPALEIKPENNCLLAVCGAHLKGLPLHYQLEELGATLVEPTTTAAAYRLYALPDSTPPKPGMVRAPEGKGAAIEIEIYEMTEQSFGRFVQAIPRPLGIGKIETISGQWISGFVCESSAITNEVEEVSHFGGWRAYLASKS